MAEVKTDKKNKSNYERYIDPTGEFTNRELKWGGWYLKHKLLIRKSTIIFLVVWCVIFGGYSIIAWGYYLAFGLSEDQRMHARQIAEFQNFTSIQSSYGADPLLIPSVEVFPGMGNKYDFVAMVQNPNERWIATVTYRFSFDGGQTDEVEAPAYPGMTLPLSVLGYETEGFPGNVRFDIVHVDWRRLDSRVVPNVADLVNSRLVFSTDNIVITPPILGGEGVPAYRLTFDLYNEGAYSYWMGEFLVDLVRGGVPVGVVKVTVPEFRAGEVYPIDLRLFDDSIIFDDIRLHPIINIFDPDAYIEPGR